MAYFLLLFVVAAAQKRLHAISPSFTLSFSLSLSLSVPSYFLGSHFTTRIEKELN